MEIQILKSNLSDVHKNKFLDYRNHVEKNSSDATNEL